MNEAISFPKAIAMGTKIQLKNKAFKDMWVREWQFSGVEKGKIVLSRPGGLILKANLENIDWEVQNKPKIGD